MIELFKALSAVSLDTSLRHIQPWQNKYLLPGVIIPFLLHLAVIYFPPLSRLFGLTQLTKREWKVILCFSLPIILLEEILKYFGRHQAEMKEAAARKFKEAKSHVHTPVVPPPLF